MRKERRGKKNTKNTIKKKEAAKKKGQTETNIAKRPSPNRQDKKKQPMTF